MEETIIFAMIERAQWARNGRVYARGAGQSLAPAGCEGESFFEHFLHETEKLHARLGRYREQDLEHAFFAVKGLPPATLARYESDVVALLTKNSAAADDGHYGSTACADIALIQALSYRINYGKLVAETKFRAKPGVFSGLVAQRDAAGIMRELTDELVERAVLERVRAKAARYARPTDASPGTVGDSADVNANGYKVDPDVISNIYRDVVIPLNKEVQVAYLLQRGTEP